ncbi:hypothetical protein BJ742DRAFT_856912 [Cladochytrium replicatum]|nr:hypothetical protein BJ742DRAFT_856912 [Cladochytrium replicatum]
MAIVVSQPAQLHAIRERPSMLKDEFAFCVQFTPRIIDAACFEGFLPMATEIEQDDNQRFALLLLKLHHERCLIRPISSMHVERNVRKSASRYYLSANKAFDGVVAGCWYQHRDVCWLYPPLVSAFKQMASNRRQHITHIYSFELWKKVTDPDSTAPSKPRSRKSMNMNHGSEEEDDEFESEAVEEERIDVVNPSESIEEAGFQRHVQEDYELVAGEIGYIVGSVYTSLTGFALESGSGTVQLCAVGRFLESKGVEVWDLGMEIPYKTRLGAKCISRESWLDLQAQYRMTKGLRSGEAPTMSLDIPGFVPAKDIIYFGQYEGRNCDQEKPATGQLDGDGIVLSKKKQKRAAKQATKALKRNAEDEKAYQL